MQDGVLLVLHGLPLLRTLLSVQRIQDWLCGNEHCRKYVIEEIRMGLMWLCEAVPQLWKRREA